MFKAKNLSALLLASVLLISMTGCKNTEGFSVDRGYKADPIRLELTVDTYDPVYLEGFMYPYFHNMIDFTTEPETNDIITETDYMGRLYPYSYALYEGNEEAQEFYRRLVDAVYDMDTVIDCSDLSLTPETTNTIFRQVVLEVPEFYYLDSTYNYDLTHNYTVSSVGLTGCAV